MKSVFSNMLVAVLSTTVSFFLFKHYYQAHPTIIEKEVPVKLVNHNDPSFVNTKPRDWATNSFNDFRQVSAQATASVVNITSLSATGYRVGSGSGVIASRNGFIITNHHVIEDGADYLVTLNDKRNLRAELIGSDPTTDLAVIRVNARNLRPMRYGNSDLVDVGEWVLAVGNPFNLASTVTAGIVSAKARNINILQNRYSIESFIQTDAVVNPGNSGGALVNTKGELIGINTAIMTESGGYEGYSFAIPSNLVKKVITDLTEYGEVQRAILGVTIKEVDDEDAERMNLPSVSGVYITEIQSGSTASSAGLRRGDVIISLNGIATKTVPELQEQVALFRPGDRISLEYYRQGRKYRKDGLRLKGLDRGSSRFRQ